MNVMRRFAALLFVGVVVFVARFSASATTAAGTAITNVSSVSFGDGTYSYTASSNTLTIYVQNVPSMTVTDPGVQNVVIAETATDTFTLTNTGNNAGTFALTGDATFGGTATGTTLKGYILNGASSGTCSTASLCATYSALNAAITGTAINGTITVGVEYQVSGSATTGQTIQPSITANVAYASATGITAQTSSNVTNTTYSDTLIADARLDLQASASTPGSSGASIAWTIKGNNGGSTTAYQSLTGANDMSPSLAAGVLIVCKLPNYGGSVLGLTGTPTVTLSGLNGSVSSQLLYTTDTGSFPSVWSTTYTASATWLAVIVYYSGQNGLYAVLPSAPSQSSGAGSVTTAQITIAFNTNQPSGNGAGNSNAVTLIANSIIADQYGNLLAPGISAGAQDTSTAATEGTYDHAAETNGTSSSGTTAPGGASNSTGSQAYASYSLTHGPYGLSGATGWYPGATGTPAADTAHDYTAYNVPCTSNSNSSVNGLSCTVSATGVIIVNEIANTGNSSDSIKITATAPTGYKVQLYAASACSGGGSTWPSCTQGSSLTSQSTDGGSVNATVTVASGAAYDYEAVYNATGNSATPFTAYTTQLAAAGQSGSGTGTDANNTYNVLFPGGVVQLTSSVSVTSTNCPAGESPVNSLVCPGGTLRYGIAYLNVVPAATASNLGTEPGFAYKPCYTTAGSLIITDDGAASPSGATAGNNWPTYTNGIAAAASDTTSGTVFTYYPSGSTTYSASQTKFTAQIGGSSYQLPPGGSGTVSFTAVVK